MLRRKPHPDQLMLELTPDDELQQVVEARAAALAHNQATRWRFRLVVIETVMITSLVLVSGIALEQPARVVLQGAALVGAGCFITGVMLLALTGVASRLLARLRRTR